MMNSRVPPRWPLPLPFHRRFPIHRHPLPQHFRSISLLGDLLASSSFAARSSTSGGGGGSGREGSFILIPGATVATILMLGFLHARRMYDDKKVEDMKEKGIEQEFLPDAKAAFLRLLPLRSISRLWGYLMSVEIPVWGRPYVYKAWARAFHSDVDEAAMPLENYASLQEFFVRSLKEGSRPINQDPKSLISPVDGKILRLGELKGSGSMIEQVKGFTYSASSLLGANSSLHEAVSEARNKQNSEPSLNEDTSRKSWWHISFSSPKIWKPMSWCPVDFHLDIPAMDLKNIDEGPKKGLFYCLIYLKPGDYHHIHSPVDWQVLARRHFSGHLYPTNERAARTIRNLYIENERVVLEGQWKEGFLALVAIGATNVGSIKLLIEPELRTNQPLRKLLPPSTPDEKIYEPVGVGLTVKKGEEVGVFNMGSTVVLVFQAPISDSPEKGKDNSDFKFCVRNGDQIRVGEAIGRWGKS